MPETAQIIISVFCSALASSGFWAWIMKRNDSKDAKTRMLKGLGHDRIIELGNSYLRRGDWITIDEYENIHDYLWLPYQSMKGNGSAEKMIKEISKLQIKPANYRPEDSLIDTSESQIES